MIYAIDKPLGLSSHGAVVQIRRTLGQRQVGHAGTLDPLATGLLLVCSGPWTRAVPYLVGHSKEYLAWICLGGSTVTLDAEGPLLSAKAVPSPTREQAAAALQGQLGWQLQTPPAYSAVKSGGQTAHRAARSGKELELAPRRVEVLAAELVGLYSDLGAAERELPKELASQPRLPPALGRFPTLLVRYQVSSGTYVRVLAADLAARLGTTAHLGGLVRLRSGQVGLEQAQLLEDFHPERALSPAAALGMDTLQLSAAQAESLRRGLQVAASRSGVFLAYGPEGLIGIVQGDGYQLRPLRNWPISSE